jgi:hypothetical protein
MNANRPLKLELDGVLGRFALAEVGMPCGLFHGQGGLTAVASGFGYLSWPGRAMNQGHTLRHRLSLYRGTPPRRIAVFDGARYDINDVSLHPNRPLAALATGRYDGGFLFEGELLLWDWERGTVSSLLPDSREVIRCRFSEDGTRLSILLRPHDEGDFQQDSFNVFYGLTFDPEQPCPPLDQLPAIDPTTLGFDAAMPGVHWEEAGRRVAEWSASVGLPFEQRHRVWDVAWLDDDTVAGVHDRCRLEVWDTHGQRLLCERGDDYGVQLLHVPGSEHVFAHVMHETRTPDRLFVRSELVLLDVTDFSVRTVQRFETPYAFSVSRGGWLLGRDVRPTWEQRRHKTRDILLDPTGAVVRRLDLGIYDVFHHYLRIDNADKLYFLQGKPPSSHEHKRLCELEPESGAWRECWPLASGTLRRRQLLEGAACLAGEDLIALAVRVYNPPGQSAGGYILGRRKQRGGIVWQHPVAAQVTALSYLEEQGVLAYALTNGTVGLLDADTGNLLHSMRAVADGVDTVVLSLSARGARLAAGTIDGRLLLLRVSC